MTPELFVEKWHASELKERSAAQEHFIDLCYLFEEAMPANGNSRLKRNRAISLTTISSYM